MEKNEHLSPGAEQRRAASRRKFIQFLAASPCIAAFGGVAAVLGEVLIDAQGGGTGVVEAQETETEVVDAQVTYPQPWEFASPTRDYSHPITDPSRALDVFDFEEPMHRKLLPGHWAHYVTAVDSEATLHANREGFNHVYLRPRRLRDMSKASTKFTIFGTTYDAPIFTCPTGGERSIWLPDGELSVSRACKTRGTMQMLDSGASESVEDCCAALGRPVVQQIYAPPQYSNTQILLKRLESAGVTTIVLTVDVATGRNTETEKAILQRIDTTHCAACHESNEGNAHLPEGLSGNAHIMDRGFDTSRDSPRSPLDWAYVDRMRHDWKGKFGIKGILTPEDAALCIRHGMDFIHVSNHSGRATETFESTIQTLPGISAEIRGRVPLFIDSGFRRGTDVFKALALGATAVGIGRPMLWGLGSFGEPGVAKVVEIMQTELKMVMDNCGTETLADINKEYVMTPDWKT